MMTMKVNIHLKHVRVLWGFQFHHFGQNFLQSSHLGWSQGSHETTPSKLGILSWNSCPICPTKKKKLSYLKPPQSLSRCRSCREPLKNRSQSAKSLHGSSFVCFCLVLKFEMSSHLKFFGGCTIGLSRSKYKDEEEKNLHFIPACQQNSGSQFFFSSF